MIMSIAFVLGGGLLCPLLGAGTAADFQHHMTDLLLGGPSTVVDCQRELMQTLGRRVEAASGIVATGRAVRVTDLDPATIAPELPADFPLRACFEVKAHGPDPIRLLLPVDENRTPAVYRRVSRGLFARLPRPPKREGQYAVFESSHPGRFVVADSPPEHLGNAGKTGLFDFTPTTADPGARSHWGLFRVRPSEINGAIPVVLIHGLSIDRWGELIAWAATSPEAEAFRRHFQLWDLYHEGTGIDAPVGYSPAFAAFEHSIVSDFDRLIKKAAEEGTETDGQRHFFPDGPFMILAHSTGGVKARAFLKYFPEYADRVLGVVSIAAPHTGTPLATLEWLRHTFTRLVTSEPSATDRLIQGALAELFGTAFMRTDRQSDLDMGWGNFDAQGGFGIPTVQFSIWRPLYGMVELTLSPRDANQTWARELPGYDDITFEPTTLRDTFCGGLDEIMPAHRGQDHLDKFFLYGAYIAAPCDWLGVTQASTKIADEKAYQEPQRETPMSVVLQNLGLNLAAAAMGLVASAGSDTPLGVYALSDGITPLQSALLLDGKETDLIYKTTERDGYRYPVLPYRPRLSIVRRHTLVNPERIRILVDWTHLDTVTGRYDPRTGHSELFSMVARDLLNALEQGTPNDANDQRRP